MPPTIGREGLTALADGATMFYKRRSMPSSAAGRIFLALKAGSVDSPWEQPKLTVAGKKVRKPRRVALRRATQGPD